MSLLGIRLPEMIGLTILHSLWQITLLWIVLVAVLRLWPRASSAIRYTLAVSTLMLSVLATLATAVYEWQLHAASGETSVLSDGTTQTMQIVYITVRQTFISRVADALNTAVPILAWLWCAGLVVMGARFGGSFYYLRTLRAQEHIAAISPAWAQELKRLSKALGLRCEVALATSARISSPLTLGSISPIILLPAALLSGLSATQIEAILVHELYHIKRRDYITNICQALVEVLLFYHPAIWHINSIIREERENCCDDRTLAFCGDALAYARALTHIQEINTFTKPTLAMSATGHNAANFSNRIKRLFNIYPNPAQARSKGIFAIGFLVVYLGIVLASANVSTALPVEPEKKPLITSVDDHNTFGNVFSDSIPVSVHPRIPDEKATTPRKMLSAASEKIDIQRADTAMTERSLEKCLKQVSLLLKMAPIYRLQGDSITFSKVSFEFRPTRFHGTVNLSRLTKLNFSTGNAGNEETKGIVLEKIRRASVDSTAVYAPQQDVAVQVFPNSTNGHLNISFTPARNASRVKMILVDSDGIVVKEITDSAYDSIPMALHVDLSGYKKGVYILQINIDGARSQQRVVVE